jgi:hypothetical protein
MFRPLLLAALIVGTAVPAAPVLAATECQAAFANFIPRIVRKSAIQAVDESYEVRLWSFCRGLQFNDLGNAAGLISTIATKPFFTDPIEDKDWSVDDVKFVRVGDGFIDLWLHRNP